MAIRRLPLEGLLTVTRVSKMAVSATNGALDRNCMVSPLGLTGTGVSIDRSADFEDHCVVRLIRKGLNAVRSAQPIPDPTQEVWCLTNGRVTLVSETRGFHCDNGHGAFQRGSVTLVRLSPSANSVRPASIVSDNRQVNELWRTLEELSHE